MVLAYHAIGHDHSTTALLFFLGIMMLVPESGASRSRAVTVVRSRNDLPSDKLQNNRWGSLPFRLESSRSISSFSSKDSDESSSPSILDADECGRTFLDQYPQKRQRQTSSTSQDWQEASSVPPCFFDLVRHHIHVFSNGEKTVVSNEELIELMSAPDGIRNTVQRRRKVKDEDRTIRKLRPSFREAKQDHRASFPYKNDRNHQNPTTSYSDITLATTRAAGSRPEDHRLLQDADQCLGSVINIIVETINVILCLLGFVSIGRAVGRSVSNKLDSNTLNDLRDIIQRYGRDVDDVSKADLIGEIFLKAAANLGFDSFMDSVFDNTEWYEWVLVIISLSAQLLAIIVSAGAAIALLVLAKLANFALFGLAIAEVEDKCEGVGRIGCYSIPGFDFYEDVNSENGNVAPIPSNRDLEEVADLCRENGACDGFNTDKWVKIVIFPYDEWISFGSPGNCEGMFIKQGVDICRSKLDGFRYFDLFDSPGDTISSQPSTGLEELAAECRAQSDCQGFNSDGDLKSLVQTMPFWTRPSNICQGLYVKDDVDVCPKAPGYTLYEGYFYDRESVEELANSTNTSMIVDVLSQACDDDEDCSGFSTFGSLKAKLKSPNEWNTTSLLCYGLYVRDDVNVTCEDPDRLPGYDFFPGLDSNGNDIQRLEMATVSEMADACNENPTCEGFNTDFWLKHQIRARNRFVNILNEGNIPCVGLFVKSGIMSPSQDNIYCSSDGPVEIRGSKEFFCQKTRFGLTRFVWETKALSSRGFDDDEYFIRVKHGAEDVYKSKEMFDIGSGSSGSELLGRSDDPIYFSVVFDCDLEWLFSSCEGGTLNFKLVDCGCPGGETPIVDCDASSLPRARNAICPATLAPSNMPSSIPTIGTGSPTSAPSLTAPLTPTVSEEANGSGGSRREHSMRWISLLVVSNAIASLRMVF